MTLATAAGLSAVLAASIVWHSAYAEFSDTTQPAPVQVSTGTVVLGNNLSASAAFAVEGLKPGASESRCFVVTSTGSVPAAVKVYGGGRTASSLSRYLSLSIVAGSGGGPNGGCAGFTSAGQVYSGMLAGFTASSFATGLDSWTTTGNVSGESRTYRITYSLPAETSVSAQDTAATIAFTWEAQSA
jgi:hypothetical protein